MDPKLDSLNSIVYIILFLIPGFIFYKVAARYIVPEKHEGNEKLISILAASSFLHALGFPVLIFFLGITIRWQSIPWLVIELLVWPTLAGLAFGWFSGSAWGEWVRRALKANPREPTAWGYLWGQRRTAIVRAVLDDGSILVGAFSRNSSASIPLTEDLYLEKQYHTDSEGLPTGLKLNTMGCWIPAARLRWVELVNPKPKEAHGKDRIGNRESGPATGCGSSADGTTASRLR
jgi:hypothetical protein